MSELKPCPFCGGEALLRERYIQGIANRKHYRRECRHCKATFADWYRSMKKADEAWNRRAQPAACEIAEYAEDCKDCGFCAQPANEPLTLDELRKMRGQVVDIPESEFWYSGRGTVLDDGVYDPKDQDGYWPFEYYGEWLAYAHKPGGEQDA